MLSDKDSDKCRKNEMLVFIYFCKLHRNTIHMGRKLATSCHRVLNNTPLTSVEEIRLGLGLHLDKGIHTYKSYKTPALENYSYSATITELNWNASDF